MTSGLCVFNHNESVALCPVSSRSPSGNRSKSLWLTEDECTLNWQVYKKVLDKPVVEHRTASVCMRENPFYVDTVRR